MDGEWSWEDKFYRALGRLLEQANMLEEALIDVYWLVTVEDEPAMIMRVRECTLGSLKALVVKTYKQRIQDPGLLERLKVLEPVLEHAVTLRNDFVHAGYIFGGTTAERRRRPRRGPAREENRRMTVEDVEAAMETIGDAAVAVWEDLYDVTVEVAPPKEAVRGGNVTPDGT